MVTLSSNSRNQWSASNTVPGPTNWVHWTLLLNRERKLLFTEREQKGLVFSPWPTFPSQESRYHFIPFSSSQYSFTVIKKKSLYRKKRSKTRGWHIGIHWYFHIPQHLEGAGLTELWNWPSEYLFVVPGRIWQLTSLVLVYVMPKWFGICHKFVTIYYFFV